MKNPASVFVGGADESFQVVADGRVVDPVGGAACVHNEKVDFVVFEHGLKVVPISGSVLKRVLAVFGVEKQHMVLKLPRSRGRIFIVKASLGLGLGFCDVPALQTQSKITGQSYQIF